MLSFKINYSEMKEGRLDPSFYHPLVNKIIKNCEKKESKFSVDILDNMSKKITLGHTFRRQYVDEEEGVMLLNGKNIKESMINYNDVVYISGIDNDKLTKSKLKPKDLLITITGQFSGVSLVVPKDILECNISANITRIILKDDHDPYYFATFLNSKFGTLFYQKWAVFSTYRHIGLTDIRLMKIPFPIKEEQTRIGLLAKKSEDLRIESNKLIEEAKNKFMSILNINTDKTSRPLTFKIDSNEMENHNFNPRYFSPYYKEIFKRLKDKYATNKLYKISKINRGTEVGNENYEDSGKIRFLRTKDLINYETNPYPDFYLEENIYNSIKNKPQENSILLTKDGKIGYLAITMKDEKIIPASGISIINVNDGLSPEYVFLALTTIFSLSQLYRKVVTGTTIPHLSLDDIKELEIPIVNDKRIEEIENMIKKAFEMKQQARILIEEGKKEIEKLIQNII